MGVIATVTVGSYAYSATYDSGNGYVYVVDQYSNNVSVINGTSLLATILVGSSPSVAVYDSGNGYVYVTNTGNGSSENSGTVSVIRGTSVVATVTVGPTPYWATYDSGNGYVYVTDEGCVSTIPGCKLPSGAPAEYGVGSNVSVISGTSVVATVPVGTVPQFVGYDSGNGYVYVLNQGCFGCYGTASWSHGEVSVISGTSVVATATVGFDPYSATYDSGNGLVYVTNGASGNVSVMNGTSVVATVPVGYIPLFAAYDSGNGYVYVPNDLTGTVSVIDGTTVAATITVESYPYSATYDSGNGYVYVTNSDAGTVSVIVGTSVVVTVNVGSGDYLVYDSNNGYVYVPSSGGTTVSVIGNVPSSSSGLPGWVYAIVGVAVAGVAVGVVMGVMRHRRSPAIAAPPPPTAPGP
ncbi:MAG: YncE family protein [Thermoplasmata archaeon]